METTMIGLYRVWGCRVLGLGFVGFRCRILVLVGKKG